eukprot:TRINITY_DN1434_c0_g1_i2.p1 TRINITY_DN1434_c0_g1~~TRINITY_DN1434_c0_g1_i2.p1  ORF type:complete len:654 (+),score=56.00 TRINITY_DN1434_c0_g1_i2:721-2682(+)
MPPPMGVVARIERPFVCALAPGGARAGAVTMGCAARRRVKAEAEVDVLLRPDIRLPGALGRNRKAWLRRFGRLPTLVRQVLEEGCPLFLTEVPKVRRISSVFSEPAHRRVFKEFLKEALEEGYVEEMSTPPTVTSRVFLVPKDTPGKWRVVIDLRYLNTHQLVPRFKQEGIAAVKSVVRKGDWCTKIDLKDGFNHVLMKTAHRRFMGFEWKGRYFRYRSMPFGSSSSPYVFREMMRPAVKWMREHGFRVVVYCDDWLVLGATKEECAKATSTLVELLKELGWRVNEEKSVMVPTQSIVYLGFNLLTKDQPRLCVPAVKARLLRKEIRRLLKVWPGKPQPRRLARVAGLVNSVSKAFAWAPVFSRALYRVIQRCKSWTDIAPWSQEAAADLALMLRWLVESKGELLLDEAPDVVVTTDASPWGWGAAVVKPKKAKASGHWSLDERRRHINFLELRAVEEALPALEENLEGDVVLVKSDNTTTVSYLRRRTGRHRELAEVALRIHKWVSRKGKRLQVEHIPGGLNTLADFLSRQHPVHEWRTTPASMEQVEARWGPHDVDRFATADNALCPRFNCRGDSAMAEGWSGVNNLVVPPVKMIGAVLQKMQAEGASGTVIAPEWSGRPWFALLMEMAKASIPVETSAPWPMRAFRVGPI